MRPHPRLARGATRGLVVAALVLGTAAVIGATAGPAAATESYSIPATGSITVVGHGNGHGHGMSQYGAQGAALDGLTTAQILAFYYHGTALTTVGSVTMRVAISEATADTCVQVAAGLSATGVTGTLPTMGIGSYRIAPSGSGLVVQSSSLSACRGPFTTLNVGTPTQIDIANAAAQKVRLYLSDGTLTDYRGTIGAVRTGSTEVTVNRVGLDQYAEGVAPREMPAEWQPAAVAAQAIAARTYGLYEHEHPISSIYDICDSSDCQVYGGAAHYEANGTLDYTDDPTAISGNSNQVLTYGGATAANAIFAQFSASDGGWTADGGQPYLAAVADPYDTAPQDPYADWTQSVPVAELDSAFGLDRVTEIEITARDGHGDLGGRVLSAVVVGTVGGSTEQVSTTGFGLQDAMGLDDEWFALRTLPSSANVSGYVGALYTSILGRGVDPSGLATWSAQLENGQPPAAVAQSLATSAEARRRLATALYTGLLGRSPDAPGLALWTGYLAGGTVISAQAHILASAEYYSHVGGTPTALIDSFYTNTQLLGRAPDPVGVAHWLALLQSGVTPMAIATSFLTSPERVDKQLGIDAQTALGRAFTAPEIPVWSPVYLASGGDGLVVVGRLDATGEVLAKYGFVS